MWCFSVLCVYEEVGVCLWFLVCMCECVCDMCGVWCALCMSSVCVCCEVKGQTQGPGSRDLNAGPVS